MVDVVVVVVDVSRQRRVVDRPAAAAYWLPMKLFGPIDNWFSRFIQQNWIHLPRQPNSLGKAPLPKKKVSTGLLQVKAPNDTYKHTIV